MYICKNRYGFLFKTIAAVLVCLFLVTDVSWAIPNAFSPPAGNPDTYAGLKFEMQRRYDLHNDVSIDPFIKSHLDSIYSLTGRIDPNHDFVTERKAIRKAIEIILPQKPSIYMGDKMPI
jgi:hypothetical protein